MNDRDLIAETIFNAESRSKVGIGSDSLTFAEVVSRDWARTPESVSDAYAAADAVLAAIGDRLLPELPEGARLTFVNAPFNNAYVHIAPVPEPLGRPTGRGGQRWVSGEGPTIPAAIRNALEAGQ